MQTLFKGKPKWKCDSSFGMEGVVCIIIRAAVSPWFSVKHDVLLPWLVWSDGEEQLSCIA